MLILQLFITLRASIMDTQAFQHQPTLFLQLSVQ